MRQKNLLVAIAVVAVMLCASIGGTLAFWVTEGLAANQIDTGTVDGKLITITEQNDSLYPGDVVPHSVNVQNTGELDMLARVKVDKSWVSGLSADNINIKFNNTYWLDGKDGYFYYKGILHAGQISAEPLFTEFELDKNTQNAYRDDDLDIDCKLELIQYSANAISAMWGKTYQEIGVSAPQTSAAAEVARVNFISPEQKFTFGQGSDTNLFKGFADLAPGEKRSQVINVANSYSDEIEVFIRAEQVNQNATGQELQKVNDLLQKHATITVRNNSGQTLYNGAIWGNYTVNPVGNNSMKNNISLGRLAKSSSTDLTVDLELAPEIGNEYQDLAGNISWVFTAEGGSITDKTPTPPQSTPTVEPRPTEWPTLTPVPTGSPVPTASSTPRPTTVYPTGSPSRTNPPTGVPKVGDDSPLPWMLLAISLLTCTLIVLVVAYRKQKKQDNSYR